MQEQKISEISKDMDLDVAWVSIVVNSPIFQAEIERRAGQLRVNRDGEASTGAGSGSPGAGNAL
jgi:hypothetical protein